MICIPFPHGSNPVRARPVVSGFIRCFLQADELEKSYKSTVQSHRPPPTDLLDCTHLWCPGLDAPFAITRLPLALLLGTVRGAS